MKPVTNMLPLVLLLLLASACSRPGDEAAATTDPAAQDSAPAAEEVVEDVAVASAESADTLPINTQSDEARALYLEGEYLMDVGRGVQARAKFMEAVEKDSGFVRAYWAASNVALSFNEFQEILDSARELLEDAADSDVALIEANRSFLTNSPAQGEAVASELVAQYPDSARAHIFLAGFQSAQNKNDDARTSYLRALRIDPQSAGALFGLASNYLFTEPKKFDKAEKVAAQFTSVYPDEAKGFELLGDIKRAQGDLQAALAAYQKAGEIDPSLELAHHKQGHINSFLGNIEEARAAYDTAIEIAPPESKANYAVYKCFTRIHEGDIAAAIDELEALADSVADMGTPADQVKGFQVFALTNAAQAALHAGMFDRAASILERRSESMMAIAEDVGTEDAARLQRANNLMWDGLLAAYQGNSEAALSAASEIESLVADDDNPRKMEPVHRVRGTLALHSEDFDTAVSELRQADHANNMYIRYQLAEALAGAGKSSEARPLYQQVADFNFNSVGFALVGDEAAEKAVRG